MSHVKALPGVHLQELRKGNSKENGNENVKVQLLSACCIQSPRISVLNSVMMVLWGQMLLGAGNVLICLGHTAVSDKNKKKLSTPHQTANFHPLGTLFTVVDSFQDV